MTAHIHWHLGLVVFQLHLLLSCWIKCSQTAPSIPDGIYRITNQRQGPCRSLTNTFNNVIMARPANTEDQFWQVINYPELPDFVQLRTSRDKVLTLSKKGVTVEEELQEESEGVQWFELVPGESSLYVHEMGHTVKMKFWVLSSVSTFVDNRCIGVQDEYDPELSSNQAEPEQAVNGWLFEPVEQIEFPPEGFDPNYEKYITFQGIPIVSYYLLSNEALYQAYFMIRGLLQTWPDAVEHLQKNSFKLAVIGAKQKGLDAVPEYRDMNISFGNTTRYLNATAAFPTAVVSEENLLCFANDSFQEDMLIKVMALSFLNIFFSAKQVEAIENLYQKALDRGTWSKTYAALNPQEYFAEGVQSFLEVNGFSLIPDGKHNRINTKEKLENFDPDLYLFIQRNFIIFDNKCSCH